MVESLAFLRAKAGVKLARDKDHAFANVTYTPTPPKPGTVMPTIDMLAAYNAERPAAHAFSIRRPADLGEFLIVAALTKNEVDTLAKVSGIYRAAGANRRPGHTVDEAYRMQTSVAAIMYKLAEKVIDPCFQEQAFKVMADPKSAVAPCP